MEIRDGSFPSWRSHSVKLPVVSQAGGVEEQPKPWSLLDDVALEAWKIILQRDYAGKHRDSPADAAQIAYEYAEAFVARRGEK